MNRLLIPVCIISLFISHPFIHAMERNQSAVQERVCALCLTVIQKNGIQIMSCAHQFHAHCIAFRIAQKSLCPLCKDTQVEKSSQESLEKRWPDQHRKCPRCNGHVIVPATFPAFCERVQCGWTESSTSDEQYTKCVVCGGQATISYFCDYCHMLNII